MVSPRSRSRSLDASVGSYTSSTGFIFVFNLIVGAGALTIPHAFARAGVFYGAVTLVVISVASYVTATFMIETMAGVNALQKWKKTEHEHEHEEERRACLSPSVQSEQSTVDSSSQSSSLQELASCASASASNNEHAFDMTLHEAVPLVSLANSKKKDKNNVDATSDETHAKLERAEVAAGVSSSAGDFDLSTKVEIAEMAHVLYNRHGLIAFYVCVIIYLFGDLSIYAVAVPKSLREMICPRPTSTATVWQCQGGYTSWQVYRFFVVVFGFAISPFTFGQLHKTRLLQIFTTIMRHSSFALMILLAFIGIQQGLGRDVGEVLESADSRNIATFFGVCIYSFMCHHSIPGLVAPVSDKSRIGSMLSSAFVAVLSVYLVLSVSATFRFHPAEIADVYTLNFQDFSVRPIAYYLSLFPVCTISANFPIICITLRENLRTLYRRVVSTHDPSSIPNTIVTNPGQFFVQNAFALTALVPPLLIAFFTEDVSMLVGFTGAYAGLAIQWIVPTSLVYCLRHRLALAGARSMSKHPRSALNPFASPFASDVWILFILCLSTAAIIVITCAHLGIQ